MDIDLIKLNSYILMEMFMQRRDKGIDSFYITPFTKCNLDYFKTSKENKAQQDNYKKRFCVDKEKIGKLFYI